MFIVLVFIDLEEAFKNKTAVPPGLPVYCVGKDNNHTRLLGNSVINEYQVNTTNSCSISVWHQNVLAIQVTQENVTAV